MMPTLRERIADWLTGGNYSASVSIARAATSEMVNKHNMAKKRGDALMSVAMQETPYANATVRRMARIAREGLK